MKHVATITVHRREPDEPRQGIRIYCEKDTFYFQLYSSTTPSPSTYLRIHTANNVVEAKREAAKLLELMRGVARVVLGKDPDLPAEMKAMEAEIPAYLHFLMTDKGVAQMSETIRLQGLAGSTN
jgi:hypothetical protein